MARVFVDANVLFPFSLMDVMLSLAEDYVHDVVWSDSLLDEWQRVVVREGHRSLDAAKLITEHIRTGFADSHVAEDAYKHLPADLDGPDHDDLHHIAAAIVGHVNTLVTWNLADFPASLLGPYGITVTPPDPDLCSLLEQFPAEVVAGIHRMAARKRRPPMSSLDVVDALERARVPAFAHRMRQLIARSAA